MRMKKKKRKGEAKDASTIMAIGRMPSPHERMKSAAKYAAREMVEASPTVQKLHNEIASAMHSAATKVLAGRAERGRFA